MTKILIQKLPLKHLKIGDIVERVDDIGNWKINGALSNRYSAFLEDSFKDEEWFATPTRATLQEVSSAFECVCSRMRGVFNELRSAEEFARHMDYVVKATSSKSK